MRRAERVRRPSAVTSPGPLGDVVFLAALCLVGIAAVWPIYQTIWLLPVALGGLVAGAGIAWISWRRRWPWWLTALVTAGAYVLLGVPLAAPSVFSVPESAPRLLLGVVAAPVTGWKDILSLDLPLGTYQTTLALVLFLNLVVTVIALSLAWRTTKLWVLAPPLGLVHTAFGVAFGSSAIRGTVGFESLRIVGATHLAIGLSALLLALGWIVWRTAAERRVALRAARAADGAGRPTRTHVARSRRWVLAAAMLVIAGVVGAAVTPAALVGAPRDVLRTAAEPELRLQRELTPLVTYRAFFDDEQFDTVLFTVDSVGTPPRVRLATLGYFDGTAAAALAPRPGESARSTAFTRVPSAITPSSGTTETSTVTIDTYRGAWVPIPGTLGALAFTGQDRIALTDGFFYNRATATGVQLASPGLVPGSSFVVDSVPDVLERDAVLTFTPEHRGRARHADSAPPSLTAWIEQQGQTADGRGLVELIDRLRARGYLSHALMIEDGRTPAWAQALGDYRFEPSRAGHSTVRLEQLFSALVERQAELPADAPDSELVAASGDDEQFSVAALLIADQLGFSARIAVGAVLEPTAAAEGGVEPCVVGACRGRNISAWLEVQDAATGAWAAIPVTPQHLDAPSAEVEQRSDPLNQTEVDPEHARLVPPPAASPSDGSPGDDATSAEPPDLGLLWTVLRVSGIILLVGALAAGPFLTVLVIKALRRRSRRSADRPVDRVVGAWDEYVDTAVDYGHPPPRNETRQELVRLYDGPQLLADAADRAVFSPETVSDAQARDIWARVERERNAFGAESTTWRRARASLSLRSLRRALDRAKRAADDARRTGRDVPGRLHTVGSER